MVSNNLLVDTTPEVYEALKRTHVQDTDTGKAHHMLKVTYSRRRTKQQIAEDKQKEGGENKAVEELKIAFVKQQEHIAALELRMAQMAEESMQPNTISNAGEPIMMIDSKSKYQK